MENVRLLRQLPLFRDLDQFELMSIGKLLRTRSVAPGEVIIEEGDRGGALFVLKSGSAVVSRKGDGRKRKLGTFKAGDHFGEISLIDEQPRSATVTAEDACEVIEVTKKDFDGLLETNVSLEKKIYRNLLTDMCMKIRKINDVMITL